MAYDLSALLPSAPDSLSWAIAWARFMLHDRVTPFVFADAEIAAVLTAHAYVPDPTATPVVTYYRPHIAAGVLIETDPDRALTESLLGAHITHQSPSDIAASLRYHGRWVDDAIWTVAGTPPPSHRTLTAVF